jgi:hypothetical protein
VKEKKMSNYPAGVTDDDPHFDLPNANDDEDADDAAEAVLRRCAKCGRPFNYPPSDNKSDATLCAWCDPVVSAQPAPDAEGEWREDASNPYLIIDSGTRQVVFEIHPAKRGREEARRLTSRIVSDHTQAAAVPQLVEALKAARSYICEQTWGVSAIPNRRQAEALVVQVDAALTTAQIQEKQ